MALDAFLKLTDDKLAKTFAEKPYNPGKDRAAFIKSLNAAKNQFTEGRTKVPNRIWSVSNDVVEFTPKYRGTPVALGGKDTVYLPAERFVEAIDALIASVNAGELDAVFEGSEGEIQSSGRGGPRGPRTFDPTSAGQASTKIMGMSKRTEKPTVAQAKKELEEAGFTPDAIKQALDKHKHRLA